MDGSLGVRQKLADQKFKNGMFLWKGQTIVQHKCEGCGGNQKWKGGNSYHSLWKKGNFYCEDAASVLKDDGVDVGEEAIALDYGGHRLWEETISGTNTGQCVMWRQTVGCDDSNSEQREPANDKACHEVISGGSSGYCECTSDGHDDTISKENGGGNHHLRYF